jgi:uncharacterized membrane protein YfcA
MTTLFGLLLGVIVGAVLGLVGAGGAILAVPGLVAVLGLSATAATTSSTIIVGSAALAGVLRRRRSGQIKIKIGLIFSALGLLGTFIGTWLLRFIPDELLLTIFALLMFGSAYAMCCREVKDSASDKPNWFAVAGAATGVGILTGLLGIGGGFLIVPALVVFLKMPTKTAVGTSLVAIAANSAIAFLLRFDYWKEIPAFEIALFTFAAIVASTLLSPLATKLNAKTLQRIFALIVASVAIYLLVQNLPTVIG